MFMMESLGSCQFHSGVWLTVKSTIWHKRCNNFIMSILVAPKIKFDDKWKLVTSVTFWWHSIFIVRTVARSFGTSANVISVSFVLGIVKVMSVPYVDRILCLWCLCKARFAPFMCAIHVWFVSKLYVLKI